MPDISTHLLLPYLLAAQAQKHVTVNEALRLLDGLVQLAVLDRHLTAPPASPADGARYIVAAGATGAWSGWDLNVAYWVDGAWMRLVPRPGWQAWVVDEATFLGWDGAAWNVAGLPAFFSDAVFELAHDADPTRRAVFDLAAIAAGATRSFALPNVSTELAGLSGAQTFDGDKTFAGELEASGPVATIGTAPGTATYGVGTGATAGGATKTVNLGTGGAVGSDTVVNIGSGTPGADGAMVINTPTVQALRDRLGKPLIIRSAYRSPEHNRAVGGAKASKHMEGIAFDVAMTNHDPEAFEEAARAAGFRGFGFYSRSGFMHIDLGPARSWGERFPKRATAFAAETPPAREVLAESRTLKGGGAAGVATVGAAGVEVAQQVIADTQDAVLPLVPYLDTLRWLFIAVALGGIAVAIYARLDDWKRGRR